MSVNTIKEIWQEGYNAFIDECGTNACPYDIGSDQWQWWIDGWNSAIEGIEPIRPPNRLRCTMRAASGQVMIYAVDDNLIDWTRFKLSLRDHIRECRLTRQEGTIILREMARQRLTI